MEPIGIAVERSETFRARSGRTTDDLLVAKSAVSCAISAPYAKIWPILSIPCGLVSPILHTMRVQTCRETCTVVSAVDESAVPSTSGRWHPESLIPDSVTDGSEDAE